jgi:hypothetical protein
MEQFALRLRRGLARIAAVCAPHLRQLLRFLALPYCYFYLVDWRHLRRRHLSVAVDLLYSFFVLNNFPDNYSRCHLYEKSRSDWAYYYGSLYNPFQRGRLHRAVQPPAYRILFEDKEVCQMLCSGAGLRMPRSYGTLAPEYDLSQQVHALLLENGSKPMFAKPVSGAAGAGIFVVSASNNGIIAQTGAGLLPIDCLQIRERYIVQEVVSQHPALARIHEPSLNTLRFLTMLCPEGEARILSVLIRFGIGEAFVDNWSAGGLAVGIAPESGALFRDAYDKLGARCDCHPNTGVRFEGYQVPEWDRVVALAKAVQRAFPFYRMLGQDVAVACDGPVLVEINAEPDLICQEQAAGPLLKNRDNFAMFGDYNLLINKRQRTLYKHMLSMRGCER